ncbi:MAG TPA: nucleoside diphosphate kinase regulator [Polyangiales bacterium]
MLLPEIIITEQDSDRIMGWLDSLPPAQRAAAGALEYELARAELVDAADVPNDVVTMNSRVVFEDVDTGRRSEALLVYPHEATKFKGGAVSVLAPVGSALLGLRAGQGIDWRMPGGKLKRYQVIHVVRQPGAAALGPVPAP